MDDQDGEEQRIDPELCLRAIEEAAARGLSFAEYLTEIVRQEPGVTPTWRGKRLELGLEELKSAAGDSETAEMIHKALRDIRIAVAGLERAQEAAAAKLDRQVNAVAASVDALESEQRALKQALANDFVELAEQALAQIDAKLGSATPHATDYEERLAALARRSSAQEETAARTAATLLDRISQVEDDLKKRLQTLAAARHKGEAALTSEIAQVAYSVRSDVDAVRTAIRDVENGRLEDRSRVAELDAALDRIAGELSVLRSFAEQGLARATDHQAQIQRHLTRVNADWDARFDALASRLGRTEQNMDRVEAVSSAEIERLETCTVAALQKLGGDIATVRSTGAAQDGEARARLDVVAESQSLLDHRLSMLEAAASRAETEQALAIIREKIAELADAQHAVTDRDDDDDVAAKHSASMATQVRSLEEQLTRMEQRHGNALDMVRAQLAQFAAENEQRLAFLESTPSSGPDVDMLAFRLARLEQRDVEADLDTLRSRLDQRMHDMEVRSIKALERLGGSIADLERRVLDGDQDAAAKSA